MTTTRIESSALRLRLLLRLLLRILGIAISLGAAGTASGQWVTPPVSAPGVQQRLFQSAAAGTTVSYHVYTPPEYDLEPDRCFPTLYWLHGAGANVSSVTPISGWFDGLIQSGAIPPMIVVMPNGMPFRMWCNSKDGLVPMESVVLDDLIPDVDANFRTIAQREARIVEGFSMGGHGAARFAFRRPDLFAGMSMLGAGPLQLDFMDAPEGGGISPELRVLIYEAVWGSDPEYYLQQHPRTIATENAEAIIGGRGSGGGGDGGLVIRQVVGALDWVLDMNLDFHDHLVETEIPHDFTVIRGVGHNVVPLWLSLGATNHAFYNDLFGGFAPLFADLNGDFVVDGADLGILLQSWGPCVGCAADLDGDGVVDGADLGLLLSAWTS